MLNGCIEMHVLKCEIYLGGVLTCVLCSLWQYLLQYKVHLCFYPTIGLLEIYPTDTLTDFQNTGIMGFIVTLFVIAKQNKIGQPYEKIKTLQTI